MRKLSIIGLFTAILAMSNIATADESEYTVSVSTGISSRYVLQDLVIEVSDKPGLTTDLAITKGPWTFDWWQRVDLAGGEYGHRGDGDEHDFTLTGNWQLGSFTVEASAAYYMLSDLDDVDTDGIQIQLDLGRPFELGLGVSVTPAIRLIQFIGFKDYPNFTQIRLRLPIAVAVPKLEGVQIVFDPSFTGAVTSGTTRDTIFRPTVSVVWQVNDALTLSVDVKDTNYTPAQVDVGLAYSF